MAVSGFSKTILFINFIVSIVSSVHAVECDRLVLALNGEPYNETEFLIPSESKKPRKNVKIKCECEDKTQPIRWLWNSGDEIQPQNDEKSRQIFAREKDPPSDGNILFIQKTTSPFKYVGAYRCTNNDTGINKTSIDIVVTDPTVEVTITPATKEVVVNNGNESLMLTCSVMGLSGGNIHWTKDGSVINDSTRRIVDSDDSGSRFHINNLTRSDEGIYHCVYDHNGAIFTSNEAVVSVKGFIEVTVEPNDMLAVEVCTEAQIKCTANGYQEDMFMYQWKLNGSDIIGATDKTLIISSVNYNDSGTYECVVTNHWGDMMTSEETELSVTGGTAPVITIDPINTSVLLHHGNESAMFSCEADGGNNVQYTWFRDGGVMVEGETSSILVLNSVTVEKNNTQYYCVASNKSGSTKSNSAHLIVNVFIEASVQPATVTAEVTSEVVFECVADGYRSETFKYQWILNGTEIPDDDNKILMITADESSMYGCVVTNYLNMTANSNLAQLTVARNPPVINAHPMNASVLLRHGNETAMFSCEVNGGHDTKYTWYIETTNGTEIIQGQMSSMLVLNPVTTEEDNTQYYCVASNKSGSVRSNSAHLTVTVFIEASIQPTSVTVEVTTRVIFECVSDGYRPETFKYHWIFNDTIIPDANDKTLTIMSVSKNESGMYRCVVTNYLNVTVESVPAQLTVTSLPKIIEHPPETIHVIVNSSTDQITLSCTVEGEGVVYWEKDGVNISDSEGPIVPGGNTLVITPDGIVATSVGMYRCIASNNVGLVMSNSTSVTVTGFIEVTVDQGHQSAEVTTEVTFTCNASGYQPDMFTYQWRLNQTDIDGAISRNYVIPSVNESDQGMYDCVVTNLWSEMKVSAPVQLNITSNPPVITTHPMNTTVSLHYGNESATFSCGVNGGGSDIKYTWYTGTVDGSRMIENATLSELVLTPVTIGMNGTQYYCVASNNSGSSTSNVAHLTVDYAIDLPVIVSHPPETIHFIVNSSTDQISLSCTVEGEGVVYWEKDGVQISDSEKPIVPGGNTLVIAPDSIVTTSVGMYRCIASNIVGSVMSSSTSVTVTGFIQVTVEQSHQSAEVTTDVTFTCNASGYQSDMFTYQWRLDQTDINSATSSNYTISSVIESNQGMYDCVVTNHWSEMKVSAPVRLNITRNPPVIVMGPQNLTVLITSDNSSKVEFSCMTEGRADHHWFRNGENVSHTRTDKKHSVYHVNIIPSHNGTQVYCEARNGSGIVRSGIATLTILVPPPKITENPQMLLNGTVGDVVAFHCEAESFGNEQALKYHWLKILNDSTTMLLSFANTSTLQFIATPEDDSTLYQCGVTNENGTVFSTVGRLNLLPIITRHPENVHVVHNTNVILQCEAVGGSNITYKWTKDGAVLLSDNKGSLMLESVQESDEGAYQCVAMNSRGETATSKNAILVVYDQFSLNINVTEDIDYFVLEGTNVYISCDVTIEPRPSDGINITWSLQNTNVDLSSIPQLVENNGTSSLILQLTNIERENKGTYVCTVDDGNVEGGINISTNVIVEYPPSITAFAEVDPIKDGENLYLLCSASGVPTPSITIYRNGEEVVSFLGGSVEQTITSASAKNDHGTYSCNASSTSRTTGQPFPDASKSIQVIVQDVPDKIAKSNRLKYNPVSLTSVNLTWGEPFDGNSPITNYTVSCGNCPMTSIVVDSNVTELVVSGLTPGVEYEFNVAAVNKFGRGQDSNTVMAQSATPESTAVKSLDAVSTNEVSVVIAWTDPELYAPMIKEYTIHAVSDKHKKMVKVPPGQHEVNITNLVPTFLYNVSVVVTYQPVSFMSEPVVHSVRLPECRACVKPVLMQPTNKNLTDLSFTIEWSLVTTGLLQNYTLSYRSVSSVKRQVEEPFLKIIIPAESTSYTVKNLTPYSSYCFLLQANYAQEDVVFSQKQSDEICDINTPPIASSAPVNLIVRDVGFTSVTMSWSAPIERHGIISHYKVYYSSKGVTESQLLDDVDNLEFQISNLNPGTEYTISVSAITYNPYGDDLEGPKSDTVETNTSFKAPELVARPSAVTSPDVDQLTVMITIPYIDQSKGEMSHYLVVVVIGSLPSTFTAPRDIPDNQLLPYDKAAMREYNYYVATGGSLVNDTHVLGNGKTITIDSTEYYNRHLNPDQQYSYFVRIYSKHNSSKYSTSELSQPFVIGSDDGEETSSPLPIIIGVVAAVCLLIIILLIFLAVYMMRLHAEKSSNQEVPIQDPTPSKAHIAVAAAAAAAQGLERRLSVPSINSQCVEICTSVGPPTTLYIEVGGKPLPEVQWFKDDNPTVHRVLPDGSLYIEKTEVANGGKYTARATNSAGQKEESVHVTVSQPSPPEGDSGHYPIRVEDFAQHVALSRSNMEELFIKEYEDLEVNQTFTQYNAKISVNKNKNRYINIIPYDHSRVPLEMDYQTTGSDYINASFIDGYCGPGEYIATQGPVPSTFSDFWQMLWERRCNTIVMLTNLKEDDKIKCHQYWPSYGSATYGRFRVTLKSVECLAEYSIRVFSVEQLNNGNDALEVHQFHYTVWPDHGVPDFGTPLLSFHSRVEKFFKRGGAPMVVHCSAGVGRTGTFIVIDTQLQRIRHLSNIDIFNNVRMLRYNRNYMVQTQSQYTFLHDVILEAIMCGDTSLGAPVQNIVERLHELATVDQDTNETLFQKQFKMLDSDVLQERKFTYTVATAPKNAAKNRYKNHLAADQNFVCLAREDDTPGYINASFVDGYRLRNAFIVTQGPLENTVSDFWQMIWEHKSHAIVMLTPLTENEEEQCYQYWPDEGNKEYGSYVVEVLKIHEPLGSELRREFKMSHVSKPMECRVITQFHFTDWPVDSCPENGASIIELIDSVERVQRKTGNGPITVHCNNGVGRSGTFCAMVASLERFKTEQMADVFQTIKKMRMQRAGIVQTPEQYQFLHKTLLEAIERFDTYSNFT